MGIQLVPGFQAEIQIKDREDQVLHVERFSSRQQALDFIKDHTKSKGCSLLSALVIPLRTDNLKDFLKDFFSQHF